MKTITVEEIMDLVSLQLGLPSVRKEHRFREDLGTESADLLNIIAAAEEKYRVILPENEASRIESVQDLYHLISENLSLSS